MSENSHSHDININRNMYIINRKLTLVKKDISQRKLAINLSIAPQTINKAITTGCTTYRINRRIADYLGVSMAEFWPELYNMPAQPAPSSDALPATANQ